MGYIDSSASFHVTLHRQLFASSDAGRKGFVRLSNDYACHIAGVGDVHHTPNLKKIWITIENLDDFGYQVLFSNNFGNISKGYLVVAKGSNSRTLSSLHVSRVKDHIINVMPQSSNSFWHCQLGPCNFLEFIM